MSKMFQVYGMGQALIPVLPPPLPFENAPNDNQTNYEIGQIVYTPPRAPTEFYIYAGAGNWVQLTDSDGPVQSVEGTANQVTVSTVDGVATISLPSALTAPGSVTVTSKLNFTTGANTSTGTSGAMVAGEVTVANTSVTANSLIFCYPDALGTVTVPQAYYISAIVASTSFTITSADATDTSTWNYVIIN